MELIIAIAILVIKQYFTNVHYNYNLCILIQTFAFFNK